MAYTQDFFTSRRNYSDGNTRIGENGRLWYDPITNTIRVSDGATSGGIIVGFGGGNGSTGYTGSAGADGTGYTGSSSAAIVSDTSPGPESTGTFWWNSIDGNLYINYQNTWVDAVSQFVLTTATTSTLGGVKIGSGISITTDGTISVNSSSIVIVSDINPGIESTGTLWWNSVDGNLYVNYQNTWVDAVSQFVLTTATAITLGGVKIGSGIKVTADGTISVTSSSAAIVSDTSPGPESTGTFWWNSIDGNLYINYQNTWVDAVSQFVLTTATTSTLGGVKIGSGISITDDGTISVTGAIGYVGSIGYTGSSSAAIVADANPGLESTGTLWWNSIDGNLYINYQNTWVDAVSQFVLTTATTSTLGGVKIGSGISITGDGTISVVGGGGNGYTGSIGYVGSGGTAIISDTAPGSTSTGILWWNSVDGNLYIEYQNTWVDAVSQFVLTTATTSTLGGVKIGSGISITGDGTISVVGENSFFYKTQTGFNVTTPSLSMDNLNVRLTNPLETQLQLQLSAISGSFNAYATIEENISGKTYTGSTNSAGLTCSAGLWTSPSTFNNLNSGGDLYVAHITDITNSRIYRVTAIHCQSTTGGYLAIERML